MEVNACHTFTASNSKHTFPSVRHKRQHGENANHLPVKPQQGYLLSCQSSSQDPFSKCMFIFNVYYCLFLYLRDKNSASLNAFPSNNLHSSQPNSLIKPLICLTLRPAPYTEECPYWGVFLSVKVVNSTPHTPPPAQPQP